MKLKVYIDVFGRMAFCERFPDDEGRAGFDEMLEEFVDQSSRGDFDCDPGFYMAEFSVEDNSNIFSPNYGKCLEVTNLAPLEDTNK